MTWPASFLLWIVAIASLGACASTRSAKAPDFDAEGLYVASDADMVGTAYADGVLKLMPGAHDALTRLAHARGVAIPASNSVVAWPGTLDVGAGRVAYVIESRGPAPEGAERLEGVATRLPEGRRINAIYIAGHLACSERSMLEQTQAAFMQVLLEVGWPLTLPLSRSEMPRDNQ